MELTGAGDVSEALTLVGELLAAEGHDYAVTILGGAALNLLGIVERTTTDVDILAFATPWAGDHAPVHAPLHEPPEPLPEPLARAARTVARDLNLDPDWLNTGPALQWRAGLPPDLETRVRWQRYAALWVGIVDRYDLVFFKLFAAADSTGPKSVHYQDLLALNPSIAELEAATSWVRQQDASREFSNILDRVVTHVRTDLGLG
jgi:hypothetical protein